MKKFLLQQSMRLHRWLLWSALVSLIVFVVSALSHPLMVWTGPQSLVFSPPSLVVEQQTMAIFSRQLGHPAVEQARLVKLVATKQGAMMQLSDAGGRRQYVSLQQGIGEEVDGSDRYDDRAQAIWLARYYTGEAADVEAVEWIDKFSTDYPSVNRLLPVYRVSFANDSGLSAYVHTETNALAGLNNHWKTSLQWVFKNLHSWSWLDYYPTLRVAIMLYLLLVLLALTASGVTLLLVLRRRHYRSAGQRFHRRLAWLVCLPLLGFIISGAYHLLQQQYGQGLQLAALPDVVRINGVVGVETHDVVGVLADQDQPLHQISVISHQGRAYLRASVAADKKSKLQREHDHYESPTSIRNQRFDGIGREQGGYYFDLPAMQPQTFSDRQVARSLALDYLQRRDFTLDDKDLTVEKVSRFGGGYDFRHKRLPVWKITLPQQSNDIIFVDTFSGLVVEHVTSAQQWEGVSFSQLHKWNMLTPILGREYRDALMVLVLLLALALAALGVVMRRR
ncbi:hypothetical protein SIN8267_02458 [Sinobacterium norvegicum]|uniref:PepSY domain-containing protein n=1 Tax=Sinobacterium norvegicum TaxID=1641715 RepID=A0ABM9AGJ8_9GAMM|nr:PepSY domain-containing protein [Sinobacterium norvegicum]CAH0992339.1 hypothetical protein SIN8267_02458 [Sinobacterium norvegicum]